MIIFAGIQPLSLIDFPKKLAAVLFTQGCCFRCSFCHNPSLVDPNQFTKQIDEEEIFSFLIKRKKQIDAVVISGGEPTIHQGLFSFCQKVKKLGFLIKLDTSGICPQILDKLIESSLIDYVAMDIKAPLKKYSSITKVPVDRNKIERSIQILLNGNIPYEFRTTVVPSFHEKEDILQMAKEIKGAKRYVLQTFRSENTLDLSLKGKLSYEEEWMQMLRELITPYVQSSSIR